MELYGYEFIRESDLAHHGILGQKWGKKNGPPYPLDAGDHSKAEKNAGWRKSLNKRTEKVIAKKAKGDDGHDYRKAIGFNGLSSPNDINKEILKGNPNAAVKCTDDDSWIKSHKKEIAIGIGVVAGTALVAAGTAYYLKNRATINTPVDDLLVKPNVANQVEKTVKMPPKDYYLQYSPARGYTGPEEYGGFHSNEERFMYGWFKANYVDKAHKISELEFQNMENAGVNLAAGHKMYRMSKGEHSTLRDGIEYVSISAEDRERYRGFLPQMWKARGFSGANVFEATLSARTSIKAPGKKETIEIMEAAMNKLYGGLYSKEVLHNDVLNHFYQYEGQLSHRGNSLAKAFFQELTARGYNATIDFNDAGNLSECPLILVNGSKQAYVHNVDKLKVSELRKEFSSIKAVKDYANFSVSDWEKYVANNVRMNDEANIWMWLK